MEKHVVEISIIILAKNEGKRIGACLDSVVWAKEKIVIDNGSIDNTAVIAKNKGAEVVESDAHDFSKLRNLGKEKATCDWIFYIDADEQVPPQLYEEIDLLIKKFNEERSPHSYFVKRENFYLGQRWPHRDKILRFFWKPSLVRWEGMLHESAVVEGQTATLENALIHHTHRTLEEMVVKTNDWSALEAILRYEANHPGVTWWRLLRILLTGFLDSFVRQGGWKAGTLGWIESIYQAFSMFITYAKLWELQRKKTVDSAGD